MRVLYIGKANLLNDIISNTISTSDDYEIHLLTTEEVENQNFTYEAPPYEVSIIDLDSVLDGKIDFVSLAHRKNISRKQLILCNNSSEVDPEQLLEAGADQTLSVDTIEIKDLLQSIEKLVNS